MHISQASPTEFSGFIPKHGPNPKDASADSIRCRNNAINVPLLWGGFGPIGYNGSDFSSVVLCNTVRI